MSVFRNVHCLSLVVFSNTTLLKLQTVLFLFFPKFCASKSGVRLIYGCGLYTDVYGKFTFDWSRQVQSSSPPFRRPKNLQDYLVRAKLRPVSNRDRGTKGTVHCKSNRCDVCNYVVPSSSFTRHTYKRSYSINYQLDCNSNNFVYLIICKVCGLQYVGSTSTKFRLRFNNHKSRQRAHSRASNIDREIDDFVYKHFEWSWTSWTTGC